MTLPYFRVSFSILFPWSRERLVYISTQFCVLVPTVVGRRRERGQSPPLSLMSAAHLSRAGNKRSDKSDNVGRHDGNESVVDAVKIDEASLELDICRQSPDGVDRVANLIDNL